MFGWKRGSQGPVGSRARGQEGDPEQGSLPWPLWGTKAWSHGQWGCLLKELLLSKPRVSGNQTQEGLFCFVLKQQGLRPTTFSAAGGGLRMRRSQTSLSLFF